MAVPRDAVETFKDLPIGERRCQVRVVSDGPDVVLVYEPRAAAPKLVFESLAGTREVRKYPAAWRTLSDRALLSLRGH